jgi:hypothetical protein
VLFCWVFVHSKNCCGHFEVVCWENVSRIWQNVVLWLTGLIRQNAVIRLPTVYLIAERVSYQLLVHIVGTNSFSTNEYCAVLSLLLITASSMSLLLIVTVVYITSLCLC